MGEASRWRAVDGNGSDRSMAEVPAARRGEGADRGEGPGEGRGM